MSNQDELVQDEEKLLEDILQTFDEAFDNHYDGGTMRDSFRVGLEAVFEKHFAKMTLDHKILSMGTRRLLEELDRAANGWKATAHFFAHVRETSLQINALVTGDCADCGGREEDHGPSGEHKKTGETAH